MLDGKIKGEVTVRVKRIEGQIRGIDKMIQEGKYCIDVIQQIDAARRALEKVALVLIQQHVKTCLTEAIADKKGNAKIQELIKALDQFLR